TYEMIGGLDKQIKEIKEVIELPVKHPELFEALGIAQPKGVLLYGPPGTGKTLLARAVAHHTDCTFIRVSGSELVQKFIGEARPPHRGKNGEGAVCHGTGTCSVYHLHGRNRLHRLLAAGGGFWRGQ
ncbi:PSMC5 isoform 19, partial [Pongo abelii]